MKKYHLVLPAVVSISAASLAVGGVSAGLQAGSCLAQAAARHPATPGEAERETWETSVGETGTDETSADGTSADENAPDETSADGTGSDGTSADENAPNETSADGTGPDETSADKPWETEPDFPAAHPTGSPSQADRLPEPMGNRIPELSPISIPEQAREDYTFCGYDFFPYDGVIELEMGAFDDLSGRLGDTVDLYVDGPDGHVSEPVCLDVEWDYTAVDFDKEGEYTVSGVLDTAPCPYELDWDNLEPPSFTLRIVRHWTISFQPRMDGTKLILNYLRDGASVSLPMYSFSLYESWDNGATWNNISESMRVRITEHQASITGVNPGCMYQLTEFYSYNFCSENSDIVAVAAEGGVLKSDVIPSGGRQGGDSWGPDQGSTWNDELVVEGLYPILGYKTNSWYSMDLDLQVVTGDDERLNRDFYNKIRVYYGNSSEKPWQNYTVLDVNWDWTPVDNIDWNQTGDTVVYGAFPQSVIDENSGVLDFEHMPKLSFTISIRDWVNSFMLYPVEEILYENQTAKFEFCTEYDEPLFFEDTSRLTVWCSVDGSETWYNITDEPNVELAGNTLSVAGLKPEYLRAKGYTIQVEQDVLADTEAYSTGLYVIHNTSGLRFGPDISGERGGGKRQEKPPEGLFDLPGGGNNDQPDQPDTPEPPTEAPTPEPPTEESTEEPAPEPSTSPGNGETDRPDGGGGGGNGGSSSGGHSSSSTSAAAPSETNSTGGPELTHSTAPALYAGAKYPPNLETAAAETRPGQDVLPEAAGNGPEYESCQPGKSPSGTSVVLTDGDGTNAAGAGAKTASDEPDSAAGEANAPAAAINGAAAEENGNTGANGSPAAGQTFRRGLSRIAAGAAAVIAGGLAGLWMIRRR